MCTLFQCIIPEPSLEIFERAWASCTKLVQTDRSYDVVPIECFSGGWISQRLCMISVSDTCFAEHSPYIFPLLSYSVAASLPVVKKKGITLHE
jgi:hypothetical protein